MAFVSSPSRGTHEATTRGHPDDGSLAGLGSAENWIFDDGFVERLRFEIDPAWQGDIPRTMLIAGDGSITAIEGSADMGELAKWVKEQLATSKLAH